MGTTHIDVYYGMCDTLVTSSVFFAAIIAGTLVTPTPQTDTGTSNPLKQRVAYFAFISFVLFLLTLLLASVVKALSPFVKHTDRVS